MEKNLSREWFPIILYCSSFGNCKYDDYIDPLVLFTFITHSLYELPIPSFRLVHPHKGLSSYHQSSFYTSDAFDIYEVYQLHSSFYIMVLPSILTILILPHYSPIYGTFKLYRTPRRKLVYLIFRYLQLVDNFMPNALFTFDRELITFRCPIKASLA